MKHKISLIILLMLLAVFGSYANNPKEEFRATWMATVFNIDWPKTAATSTTNRVAQQKELTDIFDKMKAGNMNAVCLQVRGRSDAFYQSSYEPWAAELTGTRGKDPGYDPLAFAIEEAHKRGMELHVWVNPFRVTSSGTLSTSDKVWQNAGKWIIKYNNGSFNGQIIDPGYPEAREYVLDVLMEIVENYDVDGILMDDYFYPYGGTTTEDAASKSLHKPSTGIVDQDGDGSTDDDWRRKNVNTMMKELYDRIQATKPWVRFGMGTFGIWTMKSTVASAYGISLPSGITGLDDYEEQACNPVEWVKGGYVDYINPQLYWPTTSSGQSYEKLVKWWGQDVCQHFSDLLPGKQKVHFFSSQSCSANTASSEIIKQIDYNRQYLSSGYTGSVFYNTTAYLTMYSALTSRFAYLALPPAMDWKVTETLGAPENMILSGTTLMWSHPSATRFTVYVYPKSVSLEAAKADPTYLKQIVYGNSYSVSGIDLNNYNVAVFSYDRFGVEHAAAVYGGSSDPGTGGGGEDPDPGTNPNPDTGKITWELNGGEVKTVSVPSQEELWVSFKTDADLASLGTLAEINTGDMVASCKTICTQLLTGNVQTVFNKSSWTWLYNYIATTQNAQAGTSVGSGTVPALTSDLTPAAWRYAIAAFFLQTQYTAWPYSADFTTHGSPSAWGPAYQTANGGSSLPSSVTTTFVLPTPTHPEGYTFLGWYDNPEFTGTALTSIPAGWTGTLYAKWQTGSTEEVIYWVLNGGSVSGTLPSFVTNTYELPTPVRDGYIFSGWYDNPEFAGSALSSIPAGWEGTLYAKWIEEENNNDIKWELNGGSYKNGTLPTSVSRRYTLPKEWELTPPYSGCSFEGWYDNPEFSGNSITRINSGWKGTLYAKWDCSSSNAEVIFWELNGGTVEMGSATVPSQETLWENFKTDYNAYFETNLDATLSSASNFLYSGSYYYGKEVGTLMTDADAGWTWLGEYIISFAGSPADNDLWWRTQLHAFFNCLSDYSLGSYVATDYAIAGQPTAWGEAYQAAQPAELPKFVLETYVLPTPIREGYTFRGWFDNANFGGYVLTSIPAGWAGTLYAKWTENAPAVEIYWVLNGGYTKTTLPTHVTDTYILPPLFREGYTFAGWYDNAEFSGFYLEEIPAGWQGTLYARWAESIGGPEPEEPTTITWELNGGKENPYDWSCKEDMWIMFQDDYRAFYGVEIRNYSMDSCATWTYDACGDGKAITEMLMYEEKWTWLYDYMGKVAYNANFNNGQLGTPVLLRFSLHAFLNNSAGNNNTYSGNPDYTLNGQLSYWYMDWGYTWKGYLPTSLTSTYLLPKAYKEGRTFLGWSTDPQGVGYITELPAGFVGTVYAIWDVMDDVPTSIKTNIMSKDQCMYDILGRRVDNTYKGIVIIDGKKYLLK